MHSIHRISTNLYQNFPEGKLDKSCYLREKSTYMPFTIYVSNKNSYQKLYC